MSGLLTSPPTVGPLLQFSCSHCGTELSVPSTLAGVKGPCPRCRQLIVAPALPSMGPRSTGALPTPLAPRPRLPRPAPPPEEPRVTEEARPSLRRAQAPAPPATANPAPPTDRESSVRHSTRLERNRNEPAASESGLDDATAPQPWSWAAVGIVVGAGLVFAGLSVSHLRRDTSPAPPAIDTATQSVEAGRDDDAVAALAAHKKESTRDLKSLLAAQQVVWRFFAAASAEEASPLVAAAVPPPLPADGLHSPLTSLTLRNKHRLPNDKGFASHWVVATTRFGELIVEVNDATGPPLINWTKLAPQLGLSSAPSEVRTAAAP